MVSPLFQRSKDGTRHLISYLYRKSSEWIQREFKCSSRDRLASELQAEKNRTVNQRWFRAGRSTKKDIDNLIWLLKTTISFF
jgi:hypothetical protein